jgi:hypothetical protein
VNGKFSGGYKIAQQKTSERKRNLRNNLLRKLSSLLCLVPPAAKYRSQLSNANQSVVSVKHTLMHMAALSLQRIEFVSKLSEYPWSAVRTTCSLPWALRRTREGFYNTLTMLSLGYLHSSRLSSMDFLFGAESVLQPIERKLGPYFRRDISPGHTYHASSHLCHEASPGR